MKYHKPAIVMAVCTTVAIKGRKWLLLAHETGSGVLYLKTLLAYEADE